MNDDKQFKRIQSIDALRGFDMFFIMGGSGLLVALSVLFPNAFFNALAEQTDHVAWHGLHAEDIIFPLFLFIAGMSFPFSLAKQRFLGKPKNKIYKKIIVRGLVLVLLGCIYNGLLDFEFYNMRYASVLGRIGLAWMFAALIFMNVSKRNGAIITFALLVGYCLLLTFVNAPDNKIADNLSMEGCIVGYVDRLLLPGKLYRGIHDPEGILGVIPAISTAMLGMFTGSFVMEERKNFTPCKKSIYIAVAGAILLGVGLVWSTFFPINKNLWTSSFVCTVGGISMMLFALFYFIIDVKGWRKWSYFFCVIGMNPITIYIAQRFIPFDAISSNLFGGIINLLPDAAQALGSSIGYIALCWLFLLFLYKHKVFIKV